MKKIGQTILFFGIWELIIIIFKIKKYIIPRPTMIFEALYQSRQVVLSHTLTTLFEALIGLIIAIIISLILAIIIDIKPKREQYIVPYFAIFQTIPVIVIAPILLIWFGFGMTSKILLVVILCIYPILINLIKGFRSVNPELIDFFKVANSDTKSLYLHVKLPTALPYFFAGLKLAATYCISGAMFAEYVGARSGLGIYLSRVLTNFNYELIFGIVVIVSSLTLILLGLITMIELKVLKRFGLNQKEVM